MTKRRSSPRKSTKAPPPQGISSKSLLRTSGILLIAIAFLTLLSLLSLSRGVVTEAWIGLLRTSFGWGVLPICLVMGAVGLILFLRSFDAAPTVSGERWAGLAVLLVAMLGWFHAFADDPQALAQAGAGGGLVGLFMQQTFVAWVGRLGMFVILVTLLVLGIVLAFDISTLALLAQVREAIRDAVASYRARKAGQVVISAPSQPQQNGLPAKLLNKAKSEGAKPLMEAVKAKFAPRPAASEATPLQPRVIGGEPSPWRLPSVASILDETTEQDISQSEIRHRVRIIEETLTSFGVPGKVTEVNQGPTVTQFGVEPGYVEHREKNGEIRQAKVKVNRISALGKDLELALAASPIRIEAPVPGRSVVGLEVPNAQVAVVSLRGVMEVEDFKPRKDKLMIALGRDVSGQPVVANLASMPHLLVAGATGSGKSACINALITCLLCTHTPDTLRLLLVDPKMVEMVQLNGIPHLLSPVITEVARVVETLKWATREMERRYQMFSAAGARNIESYNQQMEAKGQPTLPFLVIFIDELADIMMAAPDDVERHICRIAQMARATGIHLVIATQRPSVDVVTGLIKANFPARISFAVTSQVDSRVILDTPGAEQLLGSGDMLYMPPDSSKLARIQGCYVTDLELERLVRYWKGLSLERPLAADAPLVQKPLFDGLPGEPSAAPAEEDGDGDSLLQEAIEIVCEEGRASVSLLQRKLRIGYTRASRLIDLMEEKGIVGPSPGGSRPREVLVESGDAARV